MTQAPSAIERWPRKLLLPLNPAYRLALWLREKRLDTSLEPIRKLRYPVVSIGNLSTGGAGKTPLTIALTNLLADRGFDIDVLSRGYGRLSNLPARVNPQGTVAEFGDEPLLIAKVASVPVFVASQRYEAGRLAEASTPQHLAIKAKPIVHILDDGFQHRRLARDVDILLLDRQDWTGGLLPAGNLREPIEAARRATVIAIPAGDPEFEHDLRRWSLSRSWSGPIWRLVRKMEAPKLDGPAFAFCGIARPNQFFAGLSEQGLQLVGQTAFRDHHPYSAHDLDRLVKSASLCGAKALVTTEKDLVRLGDLASQIPASLPLKTAALRIQIENQDAALDWLVQQLANLDQPL